MSADLKSKKADLQKKVAEAVQAMRESGLAITEAQEKNEAFSEHQEKFDKAKAGFTTHKLALQNVEDALAAEAEIATVQNPVQRQAVEQQQQTQIPKTERLAAIKDARREVLKAYLRYGETEEFRAVVTQQGEVLESVGVPQHERHALFGLSGALGGFLVPEDFRAEVVKNLAGFAVVRMAGARVVPTTSSTLVFPSVAGGTNPYSSGVAGAWRAEGSQGTDGSAPATQDQPTFGQERIPVHVWQPNAIIITRELLADSAVNLDSLVAQLLAETKAHDEDYAFLRGTGVGQPRGIIDYAEAVSGPAITVVNSGSAGGFAYNALVDLMTTLPAQYRQNAVWITNSASFGKILQLKDSSQMPILYQPSLPDTFLGKKYYISEHIAAPATDSYSLILGDMRFYCIAEREDMRLQRLEERFAPNVGVLATARLGGAVLRTQAFVIQQLSA